MEGFVRVRMIQANGVDLSWFQMDYDQTFAVFFMNADGTIYGRFGTRSDEREASREISLEGFRKSMLAALDVHRGYPGNRATLAGKQGRKGSVARPEEYPSLRRFKAGLATEGKIAASCIHCHQVRDAERLLDREAGRPVAKPSVFPYPMPDVIGLRMDPLERARVREVLPGSAAARAGLEAGDEIETLQGQPVLSTADVQWVLHQAAPPTTLEVEVRRPAGNRTLSLQLAADWRDRSDISWRVSTWDLRRMTTGGLLLESLTEEERKGAKLGVNELGLRVQHVGEYGEHAAAKKAGVKPDDILVGFDGLAHAMTESQVIAHALAKRMKGTRIPIVVLRGGQRLTLELPMQ